MFEDKAKQTLQQRLAAVRATLGEVTRDMSALSDDITLTEMLLDASILISRVEMHFIKTERKAADGGKE